MRVGLRYTLIAHVNLLNEKILSGFKFSKTSSENTWLDISSVNYQLIHGFQLSPHNFDVIVSSSIRGIVDFRFFIQSHDLLVVVPEFCIAQLLETLDSIPQLSDLQYDSLDMAEVESKLTKFSIKSMLL